MIRIAALRGRSDGGGDWYASSHFQNLELGWEDMSHTITGVTKDNLVYEEYEGDHGSLPSRGEEGGI